MSSLSERYSIYCKECDADVSLVYNSDANSFRCPDCDSIYYDEDGVMDLEEAAEFYATYKGAQLAGLIPDNEIDDGLSDARRARFDLDDLLDCD